MTTGVIVPTLNGEATLSDCLDPLRAARPDRLLVVDSSSSDRTVKLASSAGAEVVTIPRSSFNHGTVREWARSYLATDVVVFVSQDAIARSAADVHLLISPILSGAADASYGRQLPRVGATHFEAYTRHFAYPPESRTATLASIQTGGGLAYSFSNAFGAWSNVALDEVGGFDTCLSNEDVIAAARILRAGGRIAYVADAACWHSHRVHSLEDAHRTFIAAYERSRRPHLFNRRLSLMRQGRRFAFGLLRSALSTGDLSALGTALIRPLLRWGAYNLGVLFGRLRPAADEQEADAVSSKREANHVRLRFRARRALQRNLRQ